VLLFGETKKPIYGNAVISRRWQIYALGTTCVKSSLEVRRGRDLTSCIVNN
jgi:hypothetical protein